MQDVPINQAALIRPFAEHEIIMANLHILFEHWNHLRYNINYKGIFICDSLSANGMYNGLRQFIHGLSILTIPNRLHEICMK